MAVEGWTPLEQSAATCLLSTVSTHSYLNVCSPIQLRLCILPSSLLAEFLARWLTSVTLLTYVCLWTVMCGIIHYSEYTVCKWLWYIFSDFRILTNVFTQYTKYTYIMAAWFTSVSLTSRHLVFRCSLHKEGRVCNFWISESETDVNFW